MPSSMPGKAASPDGLAPGAPRAQAAALEAWLALAPGLRPGPFPPPLQRSFDADTRRERSRLAGLTGIAGAAVALVLFPVLHGAVRDLGMLPDNLFLGLAIPVTLILSAFVLADPPPWLREIFLAVPVVVDTAILSWLYAHTQAHLLGLFIPAIVLLQVFAAVTIQVRFAVLLPASMISFALSALAVLARPDDGPHAAIIAVFAAICCYLMAGNYRLDTDQRRSYALMLRERLRQRELTDRNRVLDDLAKRDPLTALANRRAFDAWLADCWLDAAAHGTPLGLLMIDIDRFKAFNDAHGHPAGDGCLRAVSDCLRLALQGVSEFCARVGGEEFAVLLPGLTTDQCLATAERLREAVAGLAIPHPSHGIGGVITISCGAASRVPQEADSAAELCRAADAALYWAKRTGRNRISCTLHPQEGPAFSRGAMAAMPMP